MVLADHVMVGPTGNIVEMVDPAQSTYVPKVAAATDASRAFARKKLRGVNKFCGTHTAAGIEKTWRPGEGNTVYPTHWFNPNGAEGMDATKPRAALIYDGKLSGVMFTGTPALPYMGSIPRAHTHAMGGMGMGTEMEMEMVHVYCSTSLKEAYTPNRLLGVLADTIALRLKIRPAVMDLNEHQLRVVRAKVRYFAGDRLEPVYPTGTSGSTGPDPVLQAMRTEIRNSLMLLNEAQLRAVWRLMHSF